jgi:mRNA-degrading endonuclease HigB of HigAB toxin-antitoxin module
LKRKSRERPEEYGRCGEFHSEIKHLHRSASVLKGSRVVFDTKANDYRLSGIMMVRFFATSVPGKSGKAHRPA